MARGKARSAPAADLTTVLVAGFAENVRRPGSTTYTKQLIRSQTNTVAGVEWMAVDWATRCLLVKHKGSERCYPLENVTELEMG